MKATLATNELLSNIGDLNNNASHKLTFGYPTPPIGRVCIVQLGFMPSRGVLASRSPVKHGIVFC
jgi:hypothetical protein